MSKLTTWSMICDGRNWSICREGRSQPLSPTTRSRNAGNRLVMRHRRQHDRAGRYLRAMADLDIAKDFRASADQNAVADLRVSVATGLAGAAERNTVQNRNIVLDDRRFADNRPVA